MALLDHQVPEEAKQVTADLLQRCLGSMCVVKYPNGADKRNVVSCGMVSSMVFPDDRELKSSNIKLYTSATTFDEIAGDSIEYIYSLSMLPGIMPPDMAGLIGPMQES